MSELEAEPAGDRADGARAEESEVTSYTSDIPVANLKDSITLETTVTDPSAVINGIDETESPTSHKEYNTANPADVATMDTEDWNLDLSENKSNSQEVGSVMNEGTEEVDTTQTSVNEEEETQLKVDSEQQDKPDEGSVIRESSESKGNEIQSVENSEEMQSYDAHGPLQNLTAEADQKASNGNICEVEEPDQETSNSNISEEIQTGDAKENEEGNNAEETGGQETDMLCNQSLDIHAPEDTIEDDTSQDFNQEIIGYSISETEDAAFTESQQEDDVSVNKETENNNMNVDDESAIKDMSVEGNEDFICQENSNSQDSEQLSSNPEDLEDVTVTKKDDNAVSVELTEKEDNNQLNEERNQLLNEDNQLIDEDNTQKSEDCKQLQNEKADHTSTTNLQTCEDNYDGLSSISIQNVESHAVTDDSIHAGSQEEIFQEYDLLKDNDIKMDTSSEEKVDEDDLLKEDENTDKVHEKKSADESVSGSTDNKVIMDMDDQMGDNDTSDQVMGEQVTGDSTGEVKEVADVEMADTEASVAQTTDLDSEKVTEGKSTVTLVDEEAKTAVKSEKEATKDQDGKMEDNSATEIKVEAKKEEPKEVVEIDDDVIITDVQSAAPKQDSDGGGEMCLQISSVSGGKDVSDVLKEEEKKQNESMLKTDKQEQVIKREAKAVPTKPVKPATRQQGKMQTCIVCMRTTKCKYNIVRNGDVKHLCDDICFQKFRSSPTSYLRGPPAGASVTPPQNKPRPPPTSAPVQEQHYKTCYVCQLMNIKTSKPFLNWQSMDFCGEDCLGKFQGSLNASCSNCGTLVQHTSKGKFCLRQGNDVKQFCSNNCYMGFKKRQKLCECCQKDISKTAEAFVAPVGKDGLFKDFCSQGCLQKYEDKTNNDVEIVGVEKAHKSKVPPVGLFSCSVCRKQKTCKHEIRLDGKVHRLCSDPCLSAFQYANKLTMNTCDNCGVFCYNEGMSPQYIQFEGQQKRFCSFICVNQFKNENKKTVTCAWCNCKKSNFDMIERVDANNKYQLFCSLNCLSLYRVNLQATSNQAVKCDQCKKHVPAQYHLTMSDASVRNFCSYQCVMTFQSQFTGKQSQPPPPPPPPPPAQNNKQTPPSNRTMNTRQSTRGTGPIKQTPTGTLKNVNIPIISNVVSLAPQGKQQVNVKTNSNVPVMVNNPQTQQASRGTVTQQIIIQPAAPKSVKNKSLLCKPFVQTKATSCRPHTQTKETQTEEDFEPKTVLIPVPVPVYVPCPMAMYTQPTPVPFPIPVPIPIPCFIPTTKKSSEKILKQIKEIREKIPDDPLEAELLMMAEVVAGADEESDSDTDVEMEPPAKEPVKKSQRAITPTPVPAPEGDSPQEEADLGEDMLQMALRMATEMTEPVMDLETSIDPVPVNTDPPTKPKSDLIEEEEEDVLVYKVRETRSKRGPVKRSRGGGTKKSKRQKTNPQQQIESSADDSVVSGGQEEQEPPADANMYLKFTYGVNAWKHWVLNKNAQLEKVSREGSGRLKLFKTDMMGCTADELNYSLCLFVKEVRKPNGEEYAPDSIFYLCLGIQQFLFESGRIDNIFTDMYYEKFTECLNEVLLRYEPKVNTAGQLVCRIEEEHLWESKQLGAHSPHVLLNTLVYFNTKFFMLRTAEDHLKLSFTHIMKHWKKTPTMKGNTTGRSVYLRYYCPTPQKVQNDNNSKKKKDEMPIYEQAENLDNPLRCPVKLYEFYLSKCPESIKNRNDAFYLVPERSCVPDSPVWYSTMNLSAEALNKMLNRLRLVREIQEALLNTSPVYL